jgi:hypothetical protein
MFSSSFSRLTALLAPLGRAIMFTADRWPRVVASACHGAHGTIHATVRNAELVSSAARVITASRPRSGALRRAVLAREIAT